MILIYTTCPSMDEAKRISKIIIDRRMASAVNIWPSFSTFCWKDECREGEGAVVFIRSLEKKLQEIEDLLTLELKGGIPCIASFSVYRINRAYKELMAETVR
jgi:periplasmic divalent cation tolerance protein